ncbi:transcriptional regulator [Rhodococcus sp. D-1]|nr:transcriptional regulator [Rhodococcus sp. D-1]
MRDHGLRGRSAGIRAALRLLSTSGLERDYAIAFAEDDVDEVWDAVSADAE